MRLVVLQLSIVAMAGAQVGRVDPLHAGVIEFGVSAGYARGDVGGAKVNLPGVIQYNVEGRGGPAGALHVGLGVGSRLQFVAEAALMTGGRQKSDLGGGYQVQTKTNAVAYSAAMHVRFAPVRSFVPYLLGGAASVQSRTDTLVLFAAPAPVPGEASTAATQVRLREGVLAPIGGVGAQFFPMHKRVGIRLEAKSYFPTGSSHTPFVQVTLGVLTWVR